MRILWLQDYDIFSFQGGAEMNDAIHFAEGMRRGHDMKLINASSPFWQADLLIISNCVSFDKTRIANMVKSTPTVFFHHDYIFCKYRLYYPMIEFCGKCENAKFWLELYLQAKLNIWLSPLHREATLVALPELTESKYALVPSAIKPEPFINHPDLPRLDAFLSVHSLMPFKGMDNMLNFAALHPENQFHVINPEQIQVPGNMRIIPPVTYNEMPKLYHSYKYYIELPSTPQPFNRTVAEAKLSGCKVITNKLMGAASWDWFKEDSETMATHLLDAPNKFWTAIEEAVK